MTSVMTDGQRYGGTSVQIDIHLPPLDKRYSPIISSICGPNKMHKFIFVKLKKNNNKMYTQLSLSINNSACGSCIL